MSLEETKKILLQIKRAGGIARRYFVTNGFDGALTMLGMMSGFYSRENVDPQIALGAALGATIALFMSGLSSAYMSESAERQKELHELEQALITDLEQTDIGKASRYLPVIIALVNGLSPLFIALLILTPLWLPRFGLSLPVSPFLAAILIALTCTFLLGLFLGTISKTFWLWSGLRTLAIAIATMAIIFFFKSTI